MHRLFLTSQAREHNGAALLTGLSYAKQVALPAKEELTSTDSRRSEALLADFIASDTLKFRSRLHQVHHPFVVEEKHQIVCVNQRGVLLSQSFFPKKFASGGFKTMRYAGIGCNQEVFTGDDRRRHISRALSCSPDDMRLCHIS